MNPVLNASMWAMTLLSLQALEIWMNKRKNG